LHGRGSGDLLDLVVSSLPESPNAQEEDHIRRVVLLGRPNVGKSSLLNSLAGTARAIVDSVAGTTRDPIDEEIEFGGEVWRFIDTAGIRKHAHQASGTEYYAMLRTESALERGEVAILVIDASEPIAEQDLRIMSKIVDSGRALVIAMNKWDLVDEDRREALEREKERELNQVEWAERINISAKTGWHKDRLAPALRRALDSWQMRIPTSKLNSFLGALISATPPPVRGGKQPKILFATQPSTCPPRFVIFASGFLEPSYRRFIERRLREEFGFMGSPVEVSVRIRT
jgi:GTP-binding protein